MGSFYGLGSWTRLPIKDDEEVFIVTSEMKNPIIAKYYDYGQIHEVKLCGDFEMKDKDYNVVLSSKNTLEEIKDFINANINRPSNSDENKVVNLYVDHLFLYEEVIQPFINEYEKRGGYYSIHYILMENYFVADNSQFCASQDDISDVQLKYYETIAKFVNSRVVKREAYRELFGKRK